MTDLFLTKQDQLWEWCKDRKMFSSIDVRRWGLDNYYTTADRTVRRWAQIHKVRRLSTTEKLYYNLVKKNRLIAWYKVW